MIRDRSAVFSVDVRLSLDLAPDFAAGRNGEGVAATLESYVRG